MSVKQYIKDKIVPISLYTSLFITNILILLVFKISSALVVTISFTFIMTGIALLLYDYFRRRHFYQTLLHTLSHIDQKYLITEMIENPHFLEGQILYDVLYETGKSMNEKINGYKLYAENFKEYIELWIHEIKIPLSSGLLVLHNNQNETTAKLTDSFRKMEDYIEQVLYYARSENAEKDYLIKKIPLSVAVNKAILKYKDGLLYKKIRIEIEELDMSIHTDIKWLEFIVSQILHNSIKYSTEKDPFIKIYTKTEKEKTTLYIYDNGIGIPERDIARVFEKSFTGTNGRKVDSSTGMGLYICQKLCKKVGHKIEIESKENIYTCLSITFFSHTYYDDVR